MFGSNVKACREFLGISQLEIADKTGIKQSALSRYEKNETSPSVDTAHLIAGALGVPVDVLMLEGMEQKDIALALILKDFEKHVRAERLTLGKIEILKTVISVLKTGINYKSAE